MEVEEINQKYKYNLFKNVHLSLKNPTKKGRNYLVAGDFTYFHYSCDGYDDVVSVIVLLLGSV